MIKKENAVELTLEEATEFGIALPEGYDENSKVILSHEAMQDMHITIKNLCTIRTSDLLQKK